MRLIDRLKTGDVLYTSCVGVPFCYHIGIAVVDGTRKRIYHNSPYIKNKYGGSICSESYESFMKERELVKVTPTDISEQRVLAIARKHKREIWDSLFFNCEDFILEVVEGHRRSDLRDAYRIAALGITMLALMET